MNVTILNSSPRKGGNSEVLCKQFAKGQPMLRFDKDFSSTDSTGTAWGFISLCYTACDVE